MLIDHPARLLEAMAGIARAAGAAAMAVYHTPFTVEGKADASPVTEADRRAEAVILAALRVLTPDVPVVAEEAVAAGGLPVIASLGPRFWLVDPLDGTREFVLRNGEFTVNIALVVQGEPALGVVLAPALGDHDGGTLWAGGTGLGAWRESAQGRQPIACRQPPDEGLTVLASRAHGDAPALQAFLAGQRVARITNAGSSLKLCRLADGSADLYPRFGRTMEWDIAAGHAVLAAAGGSVRTLGGEALRYGKPGCENPDFIARGVT
jgi:3'(2'), 5'-bisphosphate nucleotidase